MSPLATTGSGGRSNFAIELDLRTTTQLAKMGSRIASSFFANRRGSLRDYSFLSSIAPQQRRCHAAVKGARGKSRSNGRRLRRLPNYIINIQTSIDACHILLVVTGFKVAFPYKSHPNVQKISILSV